MLRTPRHFTSLEGKFQNSETSMAGQILAFEKPKVHLFYMYMALTSHFICQSSDLRRQMYFIHTSSQSMSEIYTQNKKRVHPKTSRCIKVDISMTGGSFDIGIALNTKKKTTKKKKKTTHSLALQRVVLYMK